MFVPRSETDWHAEDGRVIFSSEMYLPHSMCLFKNLFGSVYQQFLTKFNDVMCDHTGQELHSRSIEGNDRIIGVGRN